MNLNSFMPVKLITGAGCVRASAKELAKLGKSCLIVTGKRSARASGALQDVTDTLEGNGQTWALFDGIGQNPRLTDCMAAAEQAIAAGAEFILGIGGGSPLDAAKCIAVLAANPGLTQAQLYAFDWAKAPLKIVAVGTTAGTGSEVTKVSVITTPDGRKKSFHHEGIFPALSLGDPGYTMSLPPDGDPCHRGGCIGPLRGKLFQPGSESYFPLLCGGRHSAAAACLQYDGGNRMGRS